MITMLEKVSNLDIVYSCSQSTRHIAKAQYQKLWKHVNTFFLKPFILHCTVHFPWHVYKFKIKQDESLCELCKVGNKRTGDIKDRKSCRTVTVLTYRRQETGRQNYREEKIRWKESGEHKIWRKDHMETTKVWPDC
jgi:hypothetical protein